MHVGHSVFEIAPAYEAACRFILTGQSFKVADLPGGLGPAERIVLAKQLVSEGLLTGSKRIEAGLLPVRVDIKNDRVAWMDFGTEPLAEPFFDQSIQSLRQRRPGAKQVITSLAELEQVGEEVAPSGFIFHISRCGSTLLSNALKCADGVIVVSEPAPISDALLPLLRRREAGPELENKAMQTIAALVCAYGRRRIGNEKGLIIKFTSWNVLFIAQIRRIWPDVPCIFVIRDPVEVAVSCLEQPSAWMLPEFRETMAEKALQLAPAEAVNISDEEFCARMLGAFLDRAASSLDEQCTVIDYADLNETSIALLASRLCLSPASGENIQQALAAYSKARTGRRPFIPDSTAKHERATNKLKSHADRFVVKPYQSLRDRSLSTAMTAVEKEIPNLASQLL
jgi:hypothetical protein